MINYNNTGEILLSPIPLGELLNGLTSKVLEAIEAKQKQELQEKLLSFSETQNIFNASKPTIIKWTKEGRLKGHRIGGRVFYKYSEVMQSLQTLKKYKREAGV